MIRWLPCLAAALATSLSAGAARADRVAVLPARGGTDDAARQTAQADVVRGLAALGHTAVPEGEVTASLWAVLDGVPDSVDEYRTLGAATSADWVLLGLVEPAVKTTRVELIAFHGPTGRVESVAREVEQDKAGPQIQEMLSVLVRIEGIGDGELPWERAALLARLPSAAPPAPPPASAAPLATEPPPPADPASSEEPEKQLARMQYITTVRSVWPAYSGGKPFGVSAVLGFSFPVARAEGARGTGASVVETIRLGYAVGGVLEPFVQLGSNMSGPSAVWVEGGARYLFTPSLHRGAKGLEGTAIHLGVEATAGAFIRPGANDLEGPRGATFERETQAGFTMSAATTLIIGFYPGLQIEAQLGNLRFVPLAEGFLLLVGATAGVGIRF
ncbi:hypothetical protein [Chondromyces crocatus]|uniref:Secreted protein n=1 Tax=Chondromyces crocatus TaxID=52 RepID=A0A0K1E6A6_CHOCO|nr:hypothetical protein [Chondromyces crocatus]AKT36389.1 uncharacterized protein CMC5_005020 [Chondromyces crocatus]